MKGVMFGDKHSFRDWGLILKSRPEISSPEPKYVYVDIPEADGQIDLTESLTGNVAYNNRTVKCEFNVIDARNRWDNIYSEILDYLHGQKMKFIKDEDSSYYYIGRFQVDEWKSDKRTSTIIISGNVEPYKLEMFSSLENWEWDSFNFETGVIREWSGLIVDGTLLIEVVGSRKPVVPTFTVKSDDGSGIDVKWKGTTYSLSDGTSKVANITFHGTTKETLTITGNGTITIDYRGGRL